MLGSNSSISYIVLCNYHSNTSCNHKDTNCEEKPKEPLGIVTEVATIIFFVAFTDFFPFISKITDPLYLPLKRGGPVCPHLESPRKVFWMSCKTLSKSCNSLSISLFRKQANCFSLFREGTEKVPLPHKNGNYTRLKSCICQYFFVPLHKNKAYVTATERT